ncbi:hypothetical protein [Paucibacter sp. M5-1]|nr:hypothetical protein [Paucibacter sp. M5-1]MCZ7883724.1 hypothetical protein [Paucibacter sp. M5-1]
MIKSRIEQPGISTAMSWPFRRQLPPEFIAAPHGGGSYRRPD